MNKKDRIAIAVSIIYFLLPLAILTEGKSDAGSGFIMTSIPIVLYWAYRFIKNDISFFKVNEKE